MLKKCYYCEIEDPKNRFIRNFDRAQARDEEPGGHEVLGIL